MTCVFEVPTILWTHTIREDATMTMTTTAETTINLAGGAYVTWTPFEDGGGQLELYDGNGGFGSFGLTAMEHRRLRKALVDVTDGHELLVVCKIGDPDRSMFDMTDDEPAGHLCVSAPHRPGDPDGQYRITFEADDEFSNVSVVLGRDDLDRLAKTI